MSSYLALKNGYIKKHTHTQSGAENSITNPFSPFYLEERKNYQSLAVNQLIMRVNKSNIAYKLHGSTVKPRRENFDLLL